jgi:hypothetical protein
MDGLLTQFRQVMGGARRSSSRAAAAAPSGLIEDADLAQHLAVVDELLQLKAARLEREKKRRSRRRQDGPQAPKNISVFGILEEDVIESEEFKAEHPDDALFIETRQRQKLQRLDLEDRTVIGGRLGEKVLDAKRQAEEGNGSELLAMVNDDPVLAEILRAIGVADEHGGAELLDHAEASAELHRDLVRLLNCEVLTLED